MTARPRRRWSFSLRTLFAAVIVAAIVARLAISFPKLFVFVALIATLNFAVVLAWESLSRKRWDYLFAALFLLSLGMAAGGMFAAITLT